MAIKSPPIAKITRPTLPEVVPRQRLFRRLDGLRRYVLTWISAPAGSGKTTLVSSWLDDRDHPCLWYQIDAGDADLASFFYYLGLAAQKTAPRAKKPLPHLTPEYLLDVPTFSRRSFESLCARVTTPFFIVFDNYQNIPSDSFFHTVLASGIAAVPEGVRVVCLSRAEPPPAFSGLLAGSKMEIIGWDELRMNPHESRAIVGLHAAGKQDRRTFEWMHERTHGWAAGLVLLARAAKAHMVDPGKIDALPQEQIFDYFATELFARTDEKVRDFLVKTSVLPTMTPAVAEALTGVGDAGAILEGLHRRNYFIYKSRKPSVTYQHHPLFRDFLKGRVREALGEEAVVRVQRRAAGLLEESGQIEDAAGLFLETKDWEGLARLALGHAQQLVAMGRYRLLDAWLSAVPPKIYAAQPWLLYWKGVCTMAFYPVESRKLFAHAFTRFQSARDPVGTHLAWAGVVDTFVYEGNDYHGAEEWIAWLDGRARDRAPFPSPEVEARSAASMAHLLLWRQTGHPDIKAWIKRSVALSEAIPDLTFQVQVRSVALLYAVWMGELPDGLMIIDDTKRRVRASTFSPLAMILWKAMEALYCVSVFDSDRSLLLVSEGLALARQHGVHVIDSILIAQGVYASLNKNDETLAKQYLEMMRIASPPARKNYCGNYQNLLAWRHLQTGNISEAVACAETSQTLAEEIGTPVPIIVTRLAVAQAVHAAGDCRKADRLLALARKLSYVVGSHYLAFVCGLVEAYFFFSRDDDNAGLRALSHAMALGRQKGLVSMHFIWRPDVMALLCARALAAGVETEYVRKLIHDLRLAGYGPPHEEAWPWPLKVITLGKFEAMSNDTLVRVEQKSARRPIELLKAVVSQGEAGADKVQLIEALWPDAEGDAGNHAFETALYRLRKLLNSSDVIALKNNRLTLDPRFCWVDAWAFERAVARIDKESREERSGKRGDMSRPAYLYEKAIDLYKGQFLPADEGQPWTSTPRERLRDKFLRVAAGLSRHWERTGKWKKAVECYRKGLEADPLAEEFYQGLMTGYDRLGLRSEAVKTYQRCKETLKASLGIEPSSGTEAVYQAIRERR